MVMQPPHYSQCGCHTAQGDRQVLSSLVCAEGVVMDHGEALKVQPTSPATMAIRVGSGNAFIEGDNVDWQGMYHVSNEDTVTMPVSAADTAQPRIDLVVARVRDSTYAGSACDWQLEIIEGVPSSPPAPPSAPGNSIPLAQYTVDADASSVTIITDLRSGYKLCPDAQPTVSRPTKLVPVSGQEIDFAVEYSWVKRVIALIAGAGGGGGGAAPTGAGQASLGRGGGAGAYARVEIFPDLLVDKLLTIQAIGVGGEPGTGGVIGIYPYGEYVGAPGGDTILTDNVNYVYARGGGSGLTDAPSGSARYFNIGGAGGVVSGVGGAAWVGELDSFYGESGRAGMNDANGIGRGGDGGASYRGLRGVGKSTSGGGGDGSDATSGNGGGGGGAYNGPSQSSPRAGGRGADGIVVLYLYDS